MSMEDGKVNDLSGSIRVRIGAGGEEEFSFYPWEVFHKTAAVSGTGLVKLVLVKSGVVYSVGVFGMSFAELTRLIDDAYAAWVGRMMVEKAAPKALEDVVTLMAGKVMGQVEKSLTEAAAASRKGLDKEMRRLVLETMRDLQEGRAEAVAEAANS